MTMTDVARAAVRPLSPLAQRDLRDGMLERTDDVRLTQFASCSG